MSEAMKTCGDNTAGNSERNTSSRTTGLKEKWGKKMDKGADNVRRFFGRKEKGVGRGEEAESGSGGGGTGSGVTLGVGTSAGLDISVLQAGTQALGQATYPTTMLPVTAGGTIEVLGTTFTSTQEINDPLDQERTIGGSNNSLPPVGNAPLVPSAAQEVTQENSAASPPASPPAPGRLEGPVPIAAGEGSDPLTTTIVALSPELPGFVGEEQETRLEAAGVLLSPRVDQAGESAVDTKPSEASGNTWAIVAGALKKTLSGAVSFIPEPFKGPAEVLLKVIDVFEQAKSNKEEMEDLKMRCNLLNDSLANAMKGRDPRSLSDELWDSIGRLVKGISDTFMDTTVKKSTGIMAYILVEDDTEALKKANQQIDQVLQCFWIENLIAGALALSDIHQTVKDQEGWMSKLCVTMDRHFQNTALDKLKNVPGAAYDSQDLAKVSTCFDGTRVKLLGGIGCWMSNTTLGGPEPGKPIYVLDGIAGIGKSTVAKTVAQRADDINSLGASFFFSRDDAERQHASSFVHTIAYQLACCNPSYGAAIATAIDNHPQSLHKIMTQQFSTLVAEPLCNMLKQRETPLIFVFDALDECVEPDASAVLSLIITSLSQLPKVKVFLTTRPELMLRNEYQNTSLASCFHLQNIEALIVDSDIYLYLNDCLSSSNVQKIFMGMKCASWVPTEEEKRKLVQAAGRLFIFASTAAKAVLDRKHLNPKRQLDAILSIKPINAITSLYMQVLNGAKPLEDYDDWMASFKTAIGALIVLQYPLHLEALANLLGVESDTLSSILANLHAVLAPVNDGPNPVYKIHHKSFADFVTNAGQSQEYFVKAQDWHLHLAKCCLATMNQQLQFNICQVSPADQYKDLTDLPDLNKEKLTQELKYAVCNWATHLNKSTLKSLDKDIKKLLEEFANIHLLHWLEALAYSGELDTAYYSMQTALAVLVSQLQ
ncbi:hypothetical protein EST38_g5027 [Candolleomyces aberdarensis]|uniref:Nephrocystin 3-like N-terminal domain-containing protein n=1 Tax=Candolleomyces aberdarensis TaxID=2316362 RepID=A0A4Q2DPF4_9AGAR|nr:hypothetical protein EST38_g5027 [Candolleomyces aberdarensis]